MPWTGVEILHNIEVDLALLQHLRAVDRETDLEVFLVVPVRAVVEDNGFIGVAVVFDSAGGGKAPFHEGGAADEGDVVEVDYLFLSMISCTSMEGVCACAYFKDELESGLPISA